jgi:hypothetical protein
LVLLSLAQVAPAQEDPARVDALERRLEEQQRDMDALREELRALREGAPPAAAGPPAAADPGAQPFDGVKLEAGLGEGVTVTAKDDSLSLNIRARIQLRFTQVEREEDGPGTSSSTQFEVRRARLLLRGHAMTRDLTYYIQLGFSNQDTEPDLRLPLRDAYLSYTRVRDLNVRIGQMKVPFNPQRVNSSSALQLVDRSIVNGELNLDRDVGVQVYSTDLFGLGDLLGYNLGVFGGDGRNRLDGASGLLFVARVQLTPFGSFDDLVEGDVFRSDEPGLAIGAAVAHDADTVRERSTHGRVFATGERVDTTHGVADVHFKYGGFSLRSEAILRWADENTISGVVNGVAVTEATRSAWGYFVQSGLMVTEHVEVVGRWGELRPLRRLSAVTLQRETGGGVNLYLHGHDLKFQTDYFYLWGDRLAEGDHQVRAQVQLYF